MPLWATLLLCAVFGLSVTLEVWRGSRWLLGLLIVGLTAVPGVKGALGSGSLSLLPLVQWQYLALLLGLGLTCWAADELEDGAQRGLLGVVLAGLLAPQPLWILALAGGAWAVPGRDTRGRPAASLHTAPRALLWPALLVGGLALLALALPRYSPAPPTDRSVGEVQQQKRPARRSTPTPPTDSSSLRMPQRTAHDPMQLPAPPFELLSVLALLVVVAYLWSLRSGSEGAGGWRKPTLPEILMVSGILVNYLLWWMFSLGGQEVSRGKAAGQDANAAASSGRGTRSGLLRQGQDWLGPLSWVVFWLTLGLLLALLGWIACRKRAAAPRLVQHEVAAQALPVAAAPPSHRVRVAYREAEQYLAERGWARGAAETPQAYASRLGEAIPELAQPWQVLATAYAPVRYGAQVGNETADAAEAAARQIMLWQPLQET